MGEIHEKINIFIGRLKSDIISCQKRFGQFGMVQILEHLFIGLPQPNFMDHHEAGLIGRLTSGFGFFGNQSAPKTPKGNFEIYVYFLNSIFFSRLFENHGNFYWRCNIFRCGGVSTSRREIWKVNRNRFEQNFYKSCSTDFAIMKILKIFQND